MAIIVRWEIKDMIRDSVSGGVNTVFWNCYVRSEDHRRCVASESGKLFLNPDSSSPDFVPYENLTEQMVLGWVWNSLIKGEETADEAKARIEQSRIEKVQAQIDRQAAQASGTPWS